MMFLNGLAFGLGFSIPFFICVILIASTRKKPSSIDPELKELWKERNYLYADQTEKLQDGLENLRITILENLNRN